MKTIVSMLKFFSIAEFFGFNAKNPSYITRSGYPRKKVSEIPIEAIVIVVGFTQEGNPIVQDVYCLQEDMRKGRTSDVTFFELDKQEVPGFEMKKTYRMIALDPEGTKAFSQVPLFIDQGCVVG